MSVDKFCNLLPRAKLGKADKKWFPRWLKHYASFINSKGDQLSISREQVIAFSQTLRDNGLFAWQRLQAVRAVEAYQNLVLETSEPSLVEIRQTLSRIAGQEKAIGSASEGRPGVRDEPNLVGIIDPKEPPVIQQMRRELRLHYKALGTERAYIGCVQQFMRFCGSEDLEQFGEPQIRAFLTMKAVEENVAPNTQNQAKCALLFLYQDVFGRELEFLDVVPATKAARLPVVLSRKEIALLFPEFTGLKRLMFQLLYGAGLRHRECRRLRVKDVCLDEGHIVVRTGKGDVDRITVLPDSARQNLIEQIERVRRLHKDDLEKGCGAVYLPYALERKYPNEKFEFGWQWMFPSRQMSKDPRSGERRRHHVCEDYFAKPFKRSIDRVQIAKNAVPHSLRHAYS